MIHLFTNVIRFKMMLICFSSHHFKTVFLFSQFKMIYPNSKIILKKHLFFPKLINISNQHISVFNAHHRPSAGSAGQHLSLSFAAPSAPPLPRVPVLLRGGIEIQRCSSSCCDKVSNISQSSLRNCYKPIWKIGAIYSARTVSSSRCRCRLLG